MFLATTADERYWPTVGPVLFLGKWCLLFSRRHVWQSLPHEVLPYHWDDRARLYTDYRTIDSVYEQTLEKLSGILNSLHGEDHSIRYWRVVIGPWLNAFIGILYDRYLSISAAEASGMVTGTLTAQYPQGRWTPKDFIEFSEWFSGDAYNHYLYSRIIEHFGTLPVESRTLQETANPPAPHDPLLKKLVAVASQAVNACGKLMPSSANSVVLESPFLNVVDLVKLQLSLSQWPRPYSPEIRLSRAEIDPRMRSQLSLSGSDDRFIGLLGKILPAQMPQCYVESYWLLKQKALSYYPRRPKVVLTANAHVQNEGFKIWAASCQENGASFVGAQHGGFEGMGKWYALEDHQKKIWDRYYTWGWKDLSEDKTKPLPSFKLIPAAKIKHDRGGQILMVNNAFIRYSYYLQSMPVGSSGYESYLSDIFAFLHALDEAPRDLVTVRPYHHDYAYSQRERIKNEFPRIEMNRGNTSMLAQMRRCRLFIGNNNTTAYLEAFTAGIPTVLFWNPGHWELRDQAKSYFDELVRCGILHYTPRAAAELVNRIYRDPLAWWSRPEIQDAKSAFCDQFARTSKTWLKEWKTELKGQTQGIRQ